MKHAASFTVGLAHSNLYTCPAYYISHAVINCRSSLNPHLKEKQEHQLQILRNTPKTHRLLPRIWRIGSALRRVRQCAEGSFSPARCQARLGTSAHEGLGDRRPFKVGPQSHPGFISGRDFHNSTIGKNTIFQLPNHWFSANIRWFSVEQMTFQYLKSQPPKPPPRHLAISQHPNRQLLEVELSSGMKVVLSGIPPGK